jgi:hypothetical protein
MYCIPNAGEKKKGYSSKHTYDTWSEVKTKSFLALQEICSLLEKFHIFMVLVHDFGFYNDSFTKRYLHDSKYVSYNDLISQLFGT